MIPDSLDTLGRVFFSRSLCRSALFAGTTLLFFGVIFSSVWFFLSYRARLPPLVMSFLLTTVIVLAWHSMWTAVRGHKILRNVYFQSEPQRAQTEPTVDVALSVAATAILGQLLDTLISLLLLLFLTSLFLRNMW